MGILLILFVTALWIVVGWRIVIEYQSHLPICKRWWTIGCAIGVVLGIILTYALPHLNDKGRLMLLFVPGHGLSLWLHLAFRPSSIALSTLKTSLPFLPINIIAFASVLSILLGSFASKRWWAIIASIVIVIVLLYASIVGAALLSWT